ncbi:hypothetical protein [Reyranella sp.]|jgi:hypothetical protein|uniref:hypothetical protein n=1 Tax=Reyranella sp. TaxID=1929291 RepID=UPI002F91E25C
MATRYLADVRQATEHRALQDLIKLYPAQAHEEWRELQAKEIARLIGARHDVRLVEVTAAEFADYCARTGAKRDIGAFTGFLWDKGKRTKGRAAAAAHAEAGR